jgi:CMP-N-acetylneuraminic acid synthetase
LTDKVVALLPMKANSERVVGKNFKDFCGKPLFRWVLDTLLDVSEIASVTINTDARDILARHGLRDSERVNIRDRPPELCGDFVSMNDVIKDDVKNIGAEFFLMTHTTNPFLSKRSIEAAISRFKESLKENRHDSLFTVNKVQERFYNSNAKPINHDPDNLLRTQDLEPWYQENSNLYLFTRNSFDATGTRIGITPTMLVTEPFESTDIDTPEDWEFAESLVNFYRGRGII